MLIFGHEEYESGETPAEPPKEGKKGSESRYKGAGAQSSNTQTQKQEVKLWHIRHGTYGT